VDVFKRILIPTDGSGFGREALKRGLELARAAGGEVTLLYALEDPASPSAKPLRTAERLRARAQEVLEQFSAQARAQGVPAKTLLAETHPVTAILEAAKDHDLIVMATHNRKGIERVLMGSVTDKVFHNCSTPLLVIRKR